MFIIEFLTLIVKNADLVSQSRDSQSSKEENIVRILKKAFCRKNCILLCKSLKFWEKKVLYQFVEYEIREF
jgi:hypothetical protein